MNALKNEGAGNNARAIAKKRPVKAIRQPQFDSFDDMLDDNTESQKEKNTEMLNFRLINDIPLQVTVELGTAKKNLNTVLNFTTGSIIVLDKQAGDLVEVIVNGKR